MTNRIMFLLSASLVFAAACVEPAAAEFDAEQLLDEQGDDEFELELDAELLAAPAESDPAAEPDPFTELGLDFAELSEDEPLSCTATVDCGGSTGELSCGAGSGMSCNSRDRNCGIEQPGWVECGGVRRHCQPCPPPPSCDPIACFVECNGNGVCSGDECICI